MNLNKDITIKVKFKDFDIFYIIILIGIVLCFYYCLLGAVFIIAGIIDILMNAFFCYKIIISDKSIKLFYLIKKDIEYFFNEITLVKIYFTSGRYSESYLEIYTNKKHSHVVTPLDGYLSILYCILKVKGIRVKYYRKWAGPDKLKKTNCEKVFENVKKKKIIDLD